MAPWEQTVRIRTELGPAAQAHLLAVTQEWSLLADLGFSDFVMLVRTWDAAGWIAVAHVRPSTAPTEIADDPVGSFVPRSRAAGPERALQSRATVRMPRAERGGGRGPLADPIEVTPVPFGRQIVAVIARYSAIDRRRLGELERQYLRACDELMRMLATGEFPIEPAARVGAAAPRVGDGIVRLDAEGRIEYASPNARTCLRKFGIAQPGGGTNLADELGATTTVSFDQVQLRIGRGEVAGEAEFSGADAIVTIRSIPITHEGRSLGALVLVRDATEVRRHERAMLSKDATIREIHHRVKNNLQTVGALLRLQARRLPDEAARAALLDAVARVGTIALVHDSLARTPGESVEFDEIAERILAVARDAGAAHHDAGIEVVVDGSFGVMASDAATPLAMALNEILLNAMEHSQARHVEVRVRRAAGSLIVEVRDDGVGFDPAAPEGLGLQIVSTLVAEQLHGRLAITSRGRTTWPTGAPPDGGDANPALDDRATMTVVRIEAPL